jgi:OOP family OmpA-OmpF porin
VGTTDFGNSSSHNNVQLNAGGGLKYAVNDTVSLRADFRLVDDVEDHQLDNITSLGVQMTFGRSSAKSTSDDSGYTPVEATTYTQIEPEPEPEPVPATEPQQAIESDVASTKAVPAEDVMQDEPVMVAPVVAQNEEPELTEQAPEVVALPPVKLNVLFGNNKTDVEQKYYPEIEKLAMYLKEHPQSTVLIEGHTDDSGAASYNQTVSEKRAKAIADVLIRTFEVSEERVSAIGYGEDTPLFDNDTAEHRKANRRVVAIISSK